MKPSLISSPLSGDAKKDDDTKENKEIKEKSETTSTITKPFSFSNAFSQSIAAQVSNLFSEANANNTIFGKNTTTQSMFGQSNTSLFSGSTTSSFFGSQGGKSLFGNSQDPTSKSSSPSIITTTPLFGKAATAITTTTDNQTTTPTTASSTPSSNMTSLNSSIFCTTPTTPLFGANNIFGSNNAFSSNKGLFAAKQNESTDLTTKSTGINNSVFGTPAEGKQPSDGVNSSNLSFGMGSLIVKSSEIPLTTTNLKANDEVILKCSSEVSFATLAATVDAKPVFTKKGK